MKELDILLSFVYGKKFYKISTLSLSSLSLRGHQASDLGAPATASSESGRKRTSQGRRSNLGYFVLQLLQMKPAEVLIESTGVIGQRIKRYYITIIFLFPCYAQF
ncbi:unnamed protein product [Prunus armeniaca]|uniref:Uncharacterized protein n=1 Tax=Prunus armeniaca TaxID=36596 RepID=A0A6J5USE9_PRUAR|nr:unnamed protein product [Prunus armeniaca]